MSRKKLLFASKDMGAAEMGIPLAEAVRAKGHEIVLAVEGLAAARYKTKGFTPFYEGTVDFMDKPSSFDANALVRKSNPDAVIVTMSSPINIEDSIGLAANNFGIPLIAVSDFWGSLTRAKKCRADLMLAIDEIDANIARRNFTHDFKIVVVGNHAIRTLRNLKISWEILMKIDDLKQRYGKIIFFAGGGTDSTTPEISLLVECLKRTSGSWVVIKRYHPKHAERIAPDGRKYREVWDANFAELSERTIELRTSEGDAVAILCDMTISGFSTMMTSAVGSCKPAAALVTPETQKSLKIQTTMTRHPLSATGLVPEIATPCDLAPFFEMRPARVAVEKILRPYEPERALAEIEKLLR